MKQEVKTKAYSNVQLRVPFSGFSLGCCINKVKVICYQLELHTTLANILTECSSPHQGESGKAQTNIAIHGEKVICYQLEFGKYLLLLLFVVMYY